MQKGGFEINERRQFRTFLEPNRLGKSDPVNVRVTPVGLGLGEGVADALGLGEVCPASVVGLGDGGIRATAPAEWGLTL